MMMAVWKFAPAIAAGNTVVLKPRDTTPETTLLLAEIAGGVPAAGRAQRRHAATATPAARWSSTRPRRWSRSPARSAPACRSPSGVANDLKRVHLELGGKAPVIVFDDADIEAAAEAIAIAGYFNAGQDCTAATRVLAGPRVHDDFVAALAEQAKAEPRSACPTTRTRCVGPVNNANQLERVAGFLDRLPDHARCSPAATGCRPSATASSSSRPSSPACSRTTRPSRTRSSARSSPCSGSPTRRRRCAGPTASHYGLASSVWTKDFGRAMRMSRRLDFGCVWINTHIPLVAEMPHGGFKHSGYGKDLSMYGFEDYTRIKHVMANIG